MNVVEKYRNGRTWREFADALNKYIPTQKKIHYSNLFNAASGKETIDDNKLVLVYLRGDDDAKAFAREMLQEKGVDLVAVEASGSNIS